MTSVIMCDVLRLFELCLLDVRNLESFISDIYIIETVFIIHLREMKSPKFTEMEKLQLNQFHFLYKLCDKKTKTPIFWERSFNLVSQTLQYLYKLLSLETVTRNFIPHNSNTNTHKTNWMFANHDHQPTTSIKTLWH